MLHLDTAWRIKASKEQLAQLSRAAQGQQGQQASAEAQLLAKERKAARQVTAAAAPVLLLVSNRNVSNRLSKQKRVL